MPTFHARADTAANPVFINRCRQAAVKWVTYRFAGSPTAAEILLGKQVLANPDTFARLFAVVAAQNDFAGDGSSSDCTLDTTAGDAALSSVIEGSVWPAFIKEVP